MNQHIKVHFSYNQIFVWDSSVSSPGTLWNDVHFEQGFVRREGVVCFATLLQDGRADVEVVRGPYVAGNFERVIQCPLRVGSDAVWVSGPDEYPEPDDHRVNLPAGSWTVTCGQSVLAERRLNVTLWFMTGVRLQSHILVADPSLKPPPHLVETGEAA